MSEQEVEAYQRSLSEGNRPVSKYVAPLPEPDYWARSDKNTYYLEGPGIISAGPDHTMAP
jgi:hypothetical protein